MGIIFQNESVSFHFSSRVWKPSFQPYVKEKAEETEKLAPAKTEFAWLFILWYL